VFASAVSFLLLPLFTKWMSPREYGTFALLLLFSSFAKILFRLGLDSGYFRIHYDLPTPHEQRRLAGSVALFATGAATALFLLTVALSGPLSRLLSADEPPPPLYVVLAAADVWLATFCFVPLAILRIEGRPGIFSAFSALRHATNVGLKVYLLMNGHGVLGVLLADVIATALFALVLSPTLLRGTAAAFDWPLVRAALGFGLPKVPHGLMVQAQNLLDRRILEAFVSRAELGIYHVGYTLGGAAKFVSAAFEPAWQPFLYEQVRKEDAPRLVARVVTYVFAGFLLCGTALAVLGRELVVVMLEARFHDAAPIVPVVAIAYVLHGAFLLGSVGIGITKSARYYPLVTAVSAGVNVVANLLLIPHYGPLGAAWATVASYAAMAGLGIFLSQRLWPVPFETGRLVRLVATAVVVLALAPLVPGAPGVAIALKLGLLVGGFGTLLVVPGFLNGSERAALLRGLGRLGGRG
jgi:O-antigen/teichoic acid export membrane protein